MVVQAIIEYGLLLALVAVLVVLLASSLIYPGPPHRPNPLGRACSACTLALITPDAATCGQWRRIPAVGTESTFPG
jgi:hypothetical protein